MDRIQTWKQRMGPWDLVFVGCWQALPLSLPSAPVRMATKAQAVMKLSLRIAGGGLILLGTVVQEIWRRLQIDAILHQKQVRVMRLRPLNPQALLAIQDAVKVRLEAV